MQTTHKRLACWGARLFKCKGAVSTATCKSTKSKTLPLPAQSAQGQEKDAFVGDGDEELDLPVEEA